MLDASLRKYLRSPNAQDNKYTRGVMGAVIVSDDFPGAAILGVGAAARTGVGMIRYVGPPQVAQLVLASYPEVVIGSGHVDAWLLGSGVSVRSEAQAAAIREASRSSVAKVLDAGALQIVDWSEIEPGTCILTPHAGELARLLDSFSRHLELDYEAVALAARLTNQVVLLKGNTTLIATPDGQVLAVGPNPTVLATAGTGDVLAGIIGALLAANATNSSEHDLAPIAALAVEIHSEAARRASANGTVVAHDLIAQIAQVVSAWQS